MNSSPVRQEWRTIPLRYVCQLNPYVDFSGFHEEDELTFLPMEKVKSGYFISNSDKFSKYVSSYNAFEEGDIVLAKVTPCFENGNIAVAEKLESGKGFGSSELFVVRPEKVNRRFLFYYFQSSAFKQAGEASMTGAGGLKRVSSDLLRKHHLPYPDDDTQRLIADYLDRETKRIDALVAEKEKMLALLEEKRAALISRAVTRGLDPNVILKSSGLDWLEEIPAHWESRRIKYGFNNIGSGTTPPTNQEEYYVGKMPWVTTSELRENVITATEKYVSPEALREFPALRTYPQGSLLFAMYGATIGRVAILGMPATVNQAVCVLADAISFVSEFVFYSLQTTRSILISYATGGGQPNLNAEKLREFRLPCPSLNEQGEICNHLRKELRCFAVLSSAIDSTIGRLKERRAALITAVVTGQIPIEEMRT